MSFLLPHFLKEGRGKLDVYFTRVYNPLWTNPDGFSWMEVLQDESKIGMHIALTPTWSETAWFADYILPMGLGTERHDTMSQETHAGPLARLPPAGAARREGEARRDARRDPRGESRRSVGRERVLDRALLEDRSGRLARHPQVLRVPVSPRREDHDGRVLRLDLRELRPGSAGSRAREDLTPLQYMRSTASSRSTTSPKCTSSARQRACGTRRRGTSCRDRPRRRVIDGWRARASRRRRGSSSSTRRRWPRGAGRNTRFRATSRATSTGAI